MERQRSEFTQGSLLNLQFRSARSPVWLGPGWALLCGAVASTGLATRWDTLVSLLLGLLLVDPLLGTVWSVVSSGGRLLASGGEGANPGQGTAGPGLPYALPGSFGYRLFAFLSRWYDAGRATLLSEEGSSLLSLLLGSLFALAIAATLGEAPFLITAVALVIAALRIGLSGARELVHLALGSCVLAGLAWLTGYGAFCDLGAISSDWSLLGKPFLWAATYAGVFHAYQLLSTQRVARGAALLNLAQIAGVIILVAVKQPIFAAIVGLLLLPQMLLQPLLVSIGDALWYLRRVQVFTLAAMMVMAAAAAT